VRQPDDTTTAQGKSNPERFFCATADCGVRIGNPEHPPPSSKRYCSPCSAYRKHAFDLARKQAARAARRVPAGAGA
jgi:hypothetical protein